MKRSKWTRILCALHCCVVLLLVPSACDRSSVQLDYSLTPVLFVHGHGLGSESWNGMIAHFRNLGYPLEYLKAIDIIPNNMSNVRAATIISEEAEVLLSSAAESARRAGFSELAPSRLNLVAHSMGAVSARWYAARLRPDRVATWISVAGANHGTNRLCEFTDDASKEMCPAFAAEEENNRVQIDLNGTPLAPVDETPFGLGTDRRGVNSAPPDDSRRILYLTVRIEPDDWIVPAESAILDGAGGVPVQIPSNVRVRETTPGNYLFLEPADHDSLLQPNLLSLVWAMLVVRDVKRSTVCLSVPQKHYHLAADPAEDHHPQDRRWNHPNQSLFHVVFLTSS